MSINELHLYNNDNDNNNYSGNDHDNNYGNGTTQKNQFITPTKIISSKYLHRQQIQQKNKTYLKALQEQNKLLIAKIKEYDQKLKNQVQIMNKKIVSPYKKRVVVPKFQEMETKELKNKFQEFQRLKKQLYEIKQGNQSIQFLENMKEQQTNKLKALKEQIKFKKAKLQNLKKIQKKSQKQQNKSQKFIQNLGEYNFYDLQIAQLKSQVNQKKTILINKKSQIQPNKNRANKSAYNLAPVQQPIEKQQLPVQILQLKREYELLGKKIDILKMKKHNLQKSLKQQNKCKNDLQKIKHRYQHLVRVKK